jgi:hypothetical protein
VYQKFHGAIPKQLVEDVNTLKDEVLALKLEVRALQVGAGKTGPMKVEEAQEEMVSAKTLGKKELKERELTNAEKGLDRHGNPLAPAPAMVAAPAEKLEDHEVKSFAGNRNHGGGAKVSSPSPAAAPAHGGHGGHSLASIPVEVSAMDMDEDVHEEPVFVHRQQRPTTSPLQDLLRRLAN